MDTFFWVVVAAVVAMVVGFGAGWLSGGGSDLQRLRNAVPEAVRRAALPALLLLGSVGIVAAMVLGSEKLGGSDQLWGQLIAAAALLLTSLLLFATGPRTYTVRKQFLDGSRTYEAKEFIPKDVYAELSDDDKGKVKEEGDGYRVEQDVTGPILFEVDETVTEAVFEAKQDHVQQQRGLYFRGLYVGMDGRWSTSKLQVLIWTYVVLYMLTASFVADQLGLPGFTFGTLEFHEEYLLLLGGPFAAAVLAKAITSQQVNDGSSTKTVADTPDQQSAAQGVREIVSDDSGRTSLPDFQYFMFNLVALAVVLVAFVPELDDGFPDLPDYLAALTSGSALTYLGAKAFTRQAPMIALTVPTRARRSETVEVHGTHLTNGPDGLPPTVTVGGVPASAQLTRRQRVPGDDVIVRVAIPETAPVGEQDLVVRPRGASAIATTKIEVVETSITSVEPESIAWSPDEALTVKGTEFGASKPASAKVLVGGAELRVVEWTESRIRGRLPPAVATMPVPTSPAVEIELPGAPQRSLPVTLTERVMSVTNVDPTTVKLAPGALIEITGTGFGSTPAAADGAAVKLGDVELDVADWSDERLLVTLPPVPAGKLVARAGGPVGLVVERNGRRNGSRTVPVALPAVAVTSVTPESVPLREDERLYIVGSGFGAPADGPPAVLLGGLELAVAPSHTDTLLEVTLPAAATLAGQVVPDAGQTDRLLVRRTGWQEGIASVKVTKPT